MTGKIIFILTVVTFLKGADAFKQLNANIDKMIARIENKTKGLMEDGKAIVLYNRTTSNDNDTHSYMIQKEKEKLSIIPMIPIGIKSSVKPVNNDVDTVNANLNDPEYEDIYESEEEKDKGGWKPIRLDENDTNDKKDERKSTAMPPPATTTTTITTTTKKPCSCGKLIKGLN